MRKARDPQDQNEDSSISSADDDQDGGIDFDAILGDKKDSKNSSKRARDQRRRYESTVEGLRSTEKVQIKDNPFDQKVARRRKDTISK